MQQKKGKGPTLRLRFGEVCTMTDGGDETCGDASLHSAVSTTVFYQRTAWPAPPMWSCRTKVANFRLCKSLFPLDIETITFCNGRFCLSRNSPRPTRTRRRA